MSKVRVILAALAGVTLCGCATLPTGDAIVRLQAKTAQMIGLASSDELTLTNVNSQKPDALGVQTYTYVATTKTGRIFNCSATVAPGVLGQTPTVSSPDCNPVKSH